MSRNTHISFIIIIFVKLNYKFMQEQEVKDYRKIYDRNYGLDKGYLKKSKVFLRPIPERGMTALVKSQSHSSFFMHDGATFSTPLPQNERGNYPNIFKTSDEQRFFETILDADLNPNKKVDNYWENFKVKITKDSSFLQRGAEFDMSDPNEVIMVKVLEYCPIVSPTWGDRFSKVSYKFALVAEDHEETVATKKLDNNAKIYKYYGNIEHSIEEMRNFMEKYHNEKKEFKEIPTNIPEKNIKQMIEQAIDTDPATVLEIINDPRADKKNIVVKGVRCGAIKKLGVNTYQLAGDDKPYSYSEFIDYLERLENITDDSYFRLTEQIRIAEEKKK